MSIDILVNGAASTVADGATVTDLLSAINIDPENSRGIAVAVNETIIRRPEWASVTLKTGDEVELVTARQGG